jgi:protein-tyrosine phosphatase
LRILFVCMGNICRSPTAAAVMRACAAEADVEVEVDSAGTGPWHVGEPPDERARAAARARGIQLDGRARQVQPEDFERFDLIVAMDAWNRDALLRLAPDERARSKVRLLLADHRDVPDPYGGGRRGFDEVLDLVEPACRALLEDVRTAGEQAE